jgi:hypothetical protein
LLKDFVTIYAIKLVILRDFVPQIVDIANPKVVFRAKTQVAVRFYVAQQKRNSRDRRL